VIWCVAAITKEEHFLVIRTEANRARCALLLLLWVFVEPGLRVELGDLLLILDFVCRQKGSCNSNSQLSIFKHSKTPSYKRGREKVAYLQPYHRHGPYGTVAGRWGNC
jgi:hypothetical protein